MAPARGDFKLSPGSRHRRLGSARGMVVARTIASLTDRRVAVPVAPRAGRARAADARRNDTAARAAAGCAEPCRPGPRPRPRSRAAVVGRRGWAPTKCPCRRRREGESGAGDLAHDGSAWLSQRYGPGRQEEDRAGSLRCSSHHQALREWYATENFSLREIGAKARPSGLKYRKSGAPVPTSTVDAILRNRLYGGEFEQRVEDPGDPDSLEHDALVGDLRRRRCDGRGRTVRYRSGREDPESGCRYDFAAGRRIEAASREDLVSDRWLEPASDLGRLD